MLDVEYLKTRLTYNPETGLFAHLPKPNPTHHEKIWNSRYAGKIAGNVAPSGFWVVSIDNKKYCGHVIAHIFMTGEYPDKHSAMDVHVNGNKTDNRWDNLRWIPFYQCRYCEASLSESNWADHNKSRAVRCCRNCENRRSAERRRKRLDDPIAGPVLRAKQNQRAQLRRRAVRAAYKALSPTDQKRMDNKFILAAKLQMITGEKFEVDHIIPLKQGGEHHPDNLQVIPRFHNRSKGHTRVEYWYDDDYLWKAIGRSPPK